MPASLSFAVTFQVAGLSTETNGLVRELQNCSQRAQNDQAVNDRLQECAFLVFPAHEQGVGRSFDVVLWLACFHRYFFLRLHVFRLLHRDPILAVQLAAGFGNPSDRIVSGDRLPVTFSWLAI
jgi:hypothetical protein